MSTNLIILGPLGSGKGTQVPVILKFFQPVCEVTYFELGELFRGMAKQPTDLGKTIKGYLQRGILVPNKIVIETVLTYLAHAEDSCGVLFDGYPRNMAQTEVLDKMLEEKGQKVDLAIYLEIPEERVLERIMGRRTCKSCGAQYHLIYKPARRQGICDVCGSQLKTREDDSNEDSIRQRYGWFVTEVKPTIDYYNERGVLETINGNQAIPRVSFDIKRVLKRRFPDVNSG